MLVGRDCSTGAVFGPNGKMNPGDAKYIYSAPVTKNGGEDSLRFLNTTKEDKIKKKTEKESVRQFL